MAIVQRKTIDEVIAERGGDGGVNVGDMSETNVGDMSETNVGNKCRKQMSETCRRLNCLIDSKLLFQ